jgi:O-methyltransferase
MNSLKRLFYSPDSKLGQILITGRAWVDALGFVAFHPSKRSLSLGRLILQVAPVYTMVSPSRLATLYRLVQEVNRLSLPGDIVECGTWNGGSAAVMAAACLEGGWLNRRDFWLFDSFKGLPRPGRWDGQKEKELFFEGWCKGDTAKAEAIMIKQGVRVSQLHIVPGWFNATLPAAEVNSIALLHIDADFYDSVKLALDCLYPKVNKGGFVVFDDYGKWEGCTRAVDHFLESHSDTRLELKRPTRTSAYLRRPL